ncbi:unnamed protein product [Paramecium octaurelia]|uniref:Transmembrane protein n=1 Tax=Paramecium octaurelia TaxID=43137 RepID=A0A8S1RRV5_PAROT|nr:unnamed protein product [Paramecium octaurelia]
MDLIKSITAAELKIIEEKNQMAFCDILVQYFNDDNTSSNQLFAHSNQKTFSIRQMEKDKSYQSFSELFIIKVIEDESFIFAQEKTIKYSLDHWDCYLELNCLFYKQFWIRLQVPNYSQRLLISMISLICFNCQILSVYYSQCKTSYEYLDIKSLLFTDLHTSASLVSLDNCFFILLQIVQCSTYILILNNNIPFIIYHINNIAFDIEFRFKYEKALLNQEQQSATISFAIVENNNYFNTLKYMHHHISSQTILRLLILKRIQKLIENYKYYIKFEKMKFLGFLICNKLLVFNQLATLQIMVILNKNLMHFYNIKALIQIKVIINKNLAPIKFNYE